MPKFEVIWYEKTFKRSVVEVATEDEAYEWEHILDDPEDYEGGYECDIRYIKNLDTGEVVG